MKLDATLHGEGIPDADEVLWDLMRMFEIEENPGFLRWRPTRDMDIEAWFHHNNQLIPAGSFKIRFLPPPPAPLHVIPAFPFRIPLVDRNRTPLNHDAALVFNPAKAHGGEFAERTGPRYGRAELLADISYQLRSIAQEDQHAQLTDRLKQDTSHMSTPSSV